jgi:hypothetical protein
MSIYLFLFLNTSYRGKRLNQVLFGLIIRVNLIKVSHPLGFSIICPPLLYIPIINLYTFSITIFLVILIIIILILLLKYV